MSIRTLLFFLAFFLVFAGGVLITRKWMQPETPAVEVQSTVLLEKVRAVCKLVTAEGYFSEVYDYKDYYPYDWSFFRKKALLRIKARVMVGFDLERMQVSAFPDEKVIRLGPIPEPEILSVDQEVDYYDLQEGTFNSFSESDLNQLQRDARAFILKRAEDSELMMRARQQAAEVQEMIRFMVENAGWQLEATASIQSDPEFPGNH